VLILLRLDLQRGRVRLVECGAVCEGEDLKGVKKFMKSDHCAFAWKDWTRKT